MSTVIPWKKSSGIWVFRAWNKGHKHNRKGWGRCFEQRGDWVCLCAADPRVSVWAFSRGVYTFTQVSATETMMVMLYNLQKEESRVILLRENTEFSLKSIWNAFLKTVCESWHYQERQNNLNFSQEISYLINTCHQTIGQYFYTIHLLLPKAAYKGGKWQAIHHRLNYIHCLKLINTEKERGGASYSNTVFIFDKAWTDQIKLHCKKCFFVLFPVQLSKNS